MKKKFTTIILASATFSVATSAFAIEPKTLQVEEPTRLQARKGQPFEVVTGTFIPLVLLNADPLMVTAQVSQDVHDWYGNVVIPRGSKVVGREVGQVKDRHDIVLTGLETPTIHGTLHLSPPLRATMPDGSVGVTDLLLGATLGAIAGEPFIIPH